MPTHRVYSHRSFNDYFDCQQQIDKVLNGEQPGSDEKLSDIEPACLDALNLANVPHYIFGASVRMRFPSLKPDDLFSNASHRKNNLPQSTSRSPKQAYCPNC
jgi:hypothetical protein